MALIENTKGRKEGSGYQRIFDNEEFGYLVSKVQSAVISAGTELERIIKSKVNLIRNLDEFLELEIMPDGVMVAAKKEIKKSRKIESEGSEPDFMVFKRGNGRQRCCVIELKDGDSFDTKKAASEHASMHNFISRNAPNIPYTVHAFFCCFNQEDKEEIFRGFKERIRMEELLTGREFCGMLDIDYDEIVESRKADGKENLKYFLSELLKIPAVSEFLRETQYT